MEQHLYDMLSWFLPSNQHTVPESETCIESMSKQVMIASSTTPREESGEFSSTRITADGDTPNESENAKASSSAERIRISEEAARAVLEGRECAFVGRETSTTIVNALIVDSGATSTLTSSFENCTRYSVPTAN
jgi:hypothetical protein